MYQWDFAGADVPCLGCCSLFFRRPVTVVFELAFLFGFLILREELGNRMLIDMVQEF